MISTLKYNSEFHDKIEFEIAVTIFSFDIHEKIKKLGRNKFKKSKLLIKNKYLDRFELFSKDHPGSISNAIKKINLLSNLKKYILMEKSLY